jgi:DNA-binding response OmpR family regulator
MGQRILAGEGFAVECVANGEEAALRFREPIRCNHRRRHLPGLNGIDLCRDVKSRSRHGVILTVSLEELDDAAAHRAGEMPSCESRLRRRDDGRRAAAGAAGPGDSEDW